VTEADAGLDADLDLALKDALGAARRGASLTRSRLGFARRAQLAPSRAIRPSARSPAPSRRCSNRRAPMTWCKPCTPRRCPATTP